MGSFSLVHWLIFGVIAILVLGGGRFSNMMGDVAKGIKNFKKGMSEEEIAAKAEEEKGPPKSIEHQSTATVEAKDAAVQKKAG